MTASVFGNIAKMTIASVAGGGTGAITLGSAATGYVSFATAGLTNGQTFSYTAVRASDGAKEVGTSVYTSSGTSMTRVLTLSTTGSLLTLTSADTVEMVITAADLAPINLTNLTILQQTTTQTANNSTLVAVSWNTTPVQDDVGAFAAGSPTIVTVPSGYTRMRVTWFFNWTSNAAGVRNTFLFKTNTGTTPYLCGQVDNAGSGSSESPHMYASRWFTVAAGDTYGVGVFQNSGSNLNLNANGATWGNCYIQFEWVK